MVAIFAANHGVAARGVSAFPASVTRAMMENFSAGGAAINQICATFGVGLKVFELALDIPTKDMREAPAMEAAAAAATFAFGMEAIAGEVDLLCIGEMGIANTTVAAAIYHGLYGGAAADWVGRGTGVDAAGLARKIATVEAAVALHRPFLDDPLELMRRLGGREIAAMAGAIVAARMQNIPVILDGYVSCAAAAILHAIDPARLDHCLAGHVSAEGAHAECCAVSAKGRCSISTCGSAKARARRSPSASSRRRSPATRAWRPSRRRRFLARRRGRAYFPSISRRASSRSAAREASFR